MDHTNTGIDKKPCFATINQIPTETREREERERERYRSTNQGYLRQKHLANGAYNHSLEKSPPERQQVKEETQCKAY